MDNVSSIKNWLGTGSINIFGPPFSGKDTQCESLAKLFDAITFGSGEILREQRDNPVIQQILSSGDLMRTDIFFDIVLPYFSKPEFTNKPLILSSVGRMKGEEAVVTDAAKQSNHPIRAVIYLTVPEADIWKRFEVSKDLKDRGARSDDGGRDTLVNRINKFNSQTLPVIDYYRQKGLLIEIDGTKDRESVTQDIMSALTERAKNTSAS